LRDEARVSRTERPASPANTALAGVLALVVVGALVPWLQGGSREFPSTRLLKDAPPGVTASLERVLRPGEAFFNAQRWGSWFELALPGHPVFSDSRIEVIPDRAWEDNTTVSHGAAGWQQILDRWGIRVLAVSPTQQAGLLPHMSLDPRWRRVYAGTDGLVFLRR
jgi:hypothetical protein